MNINKNDTAVIFIDPQNEVLSDKGGHFAGWEQPELFTAEIRAAFRSLR